MICPSCGNEFDEQAFSCPVCDFIPIETSRFKKGRHWVPILIMALIFSFGTALFFILPGTPAPAEDVADTAPWFRIEEGILYFDKTGYTGGIELTVPETVDGITVTALADGCFENCTELTSVTLPQTLLAIGEDAFRGCTALRGIEIPESVVFIGESAFAGCSSMEAVCVYGSLKHVGRGAFIGCSKLFYIYYSGFFLDWDALYGEFINPYTTVFAEDGTFYQGKRP